MYSQRRVISTSLSLSPIRRGFAEGSHPVKGRGACSTTASQRYDRPMLRLALLIALLASRVMAADVPPPKPIELYCTDGEGRRVELGGTTCIRASCLTWPARCEMSLNNVMWRKLQDGCPGVSLHGGEPALDPGAVDPEVRAAEVRPS